MDNSRDLRIDCAKTVAIILVVVDILCNMFCT